MLLAYIAWEGWREAGLEGAAWSVAILGTFFTCVVLHELGHSFTARHFGIGVRRILLMPIGGMAEFESIPREPRRELLITIAGPAVNFAIAGARGALKAHRRKDVTVAGDVLLIPSPQLIMVSD